jgi:hypothetical protein
MPRKLKRKGEDESHRALAESQQHIEEAKNRNPEVYQLAGKLKRSREVNHFAEKLLAIMSNRQGRGAQ